MNAPAFRLPQTALGSLSLDDGTALAGYVEALTDPSYDLAFARALVETLRARSCASLDVIAWNDFDYGTRESPSAAAR